MVLWKNKLDQEHIVKIDKVIQKWVKKCENHSKKHILKSILTHLALKTTQIWKVQCFVLLPFLESYFLYLRFFKNFHSHQFSSKNFPKIRFISPTYVQIYLFVFQPLFDSPIAGLVKEALGHYGTVQHAPPPIHITEESETNEEKIFQTHSMMVNFTF